MTLNIDITRYKLMIFRLFNIPIHFFIFRTYKQTRRLYGPPVIFPEEGGVPQLAPLWQSGVSVSELDVHYRQPHRGCFCQYLILSMSSSLSERKHDTENLFIKSLPLTIALRKVGCNSVADFASLSDSWYFPVKGIRLEIKKYIY